MEKCWNCNINEIPEPQYCCSGYQCGCMGKPIDPPLCDECYEILLGDKMTKNIVSIDAVRKFAESRLGYPLKYVTETGGDTKMKVLFPANVELSIVSADFENFEKNGLSSPFMFKDINGDDMEDKFVTIILPDDAPDDFFLIEGIKSGVLCLNQGVLTNSSVFTEEDLIELLSFR